MNLNKITLKNVKKYTNETEFTFQDADTINTISGKNGAGKTTIFQALILAQQAYFTKMLIKDLGSENCLSYIEKLGRQLFLIFNSTNSYVEITFSVPRTTLEGLELGEEFRQVAHEAQGRAEAAATIDEDRAATQTLFEETEEFTVSFKLFATEIDNEIVSWDIELSELNESVISQYWNLTNPQSIIAFISSNKSVLEKDLMFEELNLVQDKSISPLIKFLLDPENIYGNMYSQLLNDILYEKILPVNRGGATPRKDIYYHVSKVLYKTLFPNLEFGNFSGKTREDQFIISAKNIISNKAYDIRNFSSGEKLVWYIILFLNYIKSMGILIIDEPENHLHEELLCRFTSLLKEFADSENYKELVMNYKSETGIRTLPTLSSELEKAYDAFELKQVFLLTHSKGLIYHNFVLGKNFLLEDNLSKINFDDCERILRELGISYVNDKVLFVEGKTELNLLEKVFFKDNIKIRNLEGCSEVIKAFEGVMRVKEYLNNPQFVFLIDKDTRDDDEIERLRNSYPDDFENYFKVMDYHEIENYFLRSDVIHQTLQRYVTEEYTPVSVEEIERKIFVIATEQLKYTKKKYLNFIINNNLEKMKRLVRQNDIPIEDVDSFATYIDDTLNGNQHAVLLENIKQLYNQMENKYSDEEWRGKYKFLMDGKSVFGIITKLLAHPAEINSSRLKREIKEKIINDSNSDLNQLISDIRLKFGIQ